MWPSGKIVVALTILIGHWHVQGLQYQSFRKEWKFRDGAIFKYSRSIVAEDNSFLFAVCTDKKLPAELNCNVTIETPIYPWNANESLRSTCELRLTGSEDGLSEVTGIESVERFADNRAIVVWWEGQKNSQFQVYNIKVSILHMTDCTVTHLTYPVDVDRPVLLSNVVVYTNTFDIVISNKAICGSGACRLTHDVDGQQIGQAIPFVTNFYLFHTQSVASHSPAKGFYISGSDIDRWKFRAMHVTPSGTGKSLMTVSVSDPMQVYRATSNAHELFGICLMGVKKIHCAQFDALANVRLNATLSNSIQWMAVHNLAEGGILLLTGRCNNHKCRSFKVMVVYPNGRQDKLLDVPGLQLTCSNGPQVEISESESAFCVYFACAHAQDSGKKKVRISLKFSSKCVLKSEFKM